MDIKSNHLLSFILERESVGAGKVFHSAEHGICIATKQGTSINLADGGDREILPNASVILLPKAIVIPHGLPE